MLIDLHCHTKKVKTGDAITRNVTTEIFAQKVSEANVKIVAITNHNLFDYEQYLVLKDAVRGYCDIWPGVELDISGNKSNDGKNNRGHLIVIANPKNQELFNERIKRLINGRNADEFIVDVKTVFECLDSCDTIYIPHFHKEPKLSEEDISELDDLLKDKSRLFKETSDYRSLGVFSNFDYSVIIGSDIQDWNRYEKSKFADIRLPIQTFEQFCLLAKKDKQIINTLLNQKNKKIIEVSPYKNINFNIPIYEDVNVIFGQKGTGKSEIILSLKKHYEENGTLYKCYIGTAKDDDFNKLLRTDDVKRDPEKLGLEDMSQQFLSIYEWQDKNITPIEKYVNWWKTKDNNSNKSRMKITNCVKVEEEKKDKKLGNDYKKFNDFVQSSFLKLEFNRYLSIEEIKSLQTILQHLQNEIEKQITDSWIIEQTNKLTNWSIERIKGIADKCSDTVSKPSTTGFYEYAMNRFLLLENIDLIEETFKKEEFIDKQLLGTLEEKGDIFIQTRYRLLCKDSRTVEFRLGIKSLKECKQILDNIQQKVSLETLSEEIATFRTYFDDGIKDIVDFIGISKDTVLDNGLNYKPSNGERGILLMQNLLEADSEVYLLDEPELGMGNSYITSAILPKIIELAKQRKTVIIATHNANLAVSTLPYISILRTHNKNSEYNTYIGNAFYDELKNINDDSDIKNWTLESMHTLEGGRPAFYGRRDIYESGVQDN